MSDKKKMYSTKKGTKTNTWSSKRSNVSKRRLLNRYEAEADREYITTSAKKLKMSEDNDDIEINYFGACVQKVLDKCYIHRVD